VGVYFMDEAMAAGMREMKAQLVSETSVTTVAVAYFS
jgi:hypothetical protein